MVKNTGNIIEGILSPSSCTGGGTEVLRRLLGLAKHEHCDLIAGRSVREILTAVEAQGIIHPDVKFSARIRQLYAVNFALGETLPLEKHEIYPIDAKLRSL